MTTLEVKVLPPDEIKKTTLTHERVKLDFAGDLAVRLLPVFAHVGKPDGETSAGYAKMRPYEPQELVDHTVKVTELLIAALYAQDWLAILPPLDSMLVDNREKTGFA